MYNKRLLSKIDLGKYSKPNPYAKDIITDPQGQYKYPGQPTRIPSSDITMKGVGYPVLGIADNGKKQMMQPGQEYQFPGAKYVDEYPQMKKGGGLDSKKYTRSLDGIGELFRESSLFKKPKSKKKKFFHPKAKNFKKGGAYYDDSRDAWVYPDGTVGPNGPAYYQEGGDTNPNPPLTPEQQEYLRLKYEAAKKVQMAAKAGDPNAKVLAAEFKNKYPNESWTCPSNNCPAPTQQKVNEYPTGYNPVVNNTPQTTPEGKIKVGEQKVQQLDPVTGKVTTVINPIYEDTMQPMPTLKPKSIDKLITNQPLAQEEDEQMDELSTYSEEQGQAGPGGHWEDKTSRYINWDGNSIGFNGVRFRKPGHGGDLIKKGRRHYIHYPSIEKRYDAWIEPEEYQIGGAAATPFDLDPEHMKRYLADLRMQENSVKKGYKNGMWYPHASVEGGADTIAYGHKLTPNDSALRRGITEDQALKLQEQDVLRNQALAKKQVDKKYGTGTFDNLPQDSQMLLVDYQYNLGTLSGFPSFVKATVEGNKEKMLAEHKRFGAGQPLTKRNEWTANVINNMEIPKPYDPMKEVTVPLANVPDATNVVQPVVLEGPAEVELPPQKYQGGGVVELNGNQYKKDSKGAWTFTSGAPVTDVMTLQKLNYGEGKPVGSPVVQEAPGRQKAKENIVAASKNIKPQPIERNVPRANVSDQTAVVQPFIPKPSFVDQPNPALSLEDSQMLLQNEAQRLITSGAAKDMGITAKYLSPQNANSANPKSLQQLMIEEMTKKDFQKKLDQARLNQVNKKWNQSSILGKAGDVTRSFLADPINVTEEAIWGDQYLPDRANILRDPRNPLNAYYRKETGYDNSTLNNMVSMINPFSSAAEATVYARQGNLLGTAKEFGEGLAKAALLSKAPGALNSLMSRRVGLGALGTTDLGTLAGATGVASGTLALPSTVKALYKAGETGKKEDIRAAVNQAGINALDFIAPEVIGSKGALSALMKGERLTPLQQLSRQNIITRSTSNQLQEIAGSANDMQNQLSNLYDQRREVDRIIQGLRNEGNTNSPFFQGALDERDYLTRQIDDFNTQTRDRIATQIQSAVNLEPSAVASNAAATAAQNMNQRLTGSIDLRRPAPGVTEYTGSNLPAPIRTSQVYGEIANQLGNTNLKPIEFSEVTRQALRRRPDRTRMTLEAQLRDANDPIDFVNRLRNYYANGTINREAYDELLNGLKDVMKPKSDAYEDFDFFKEIASTNPDKPYTGGLLPGNEVLNKLKQIPDKELDVILRDNYGYGLKDIEFLFNTGSGVSRDASKIALNQIFDDYNFITKYNIPNPHAPAIDFRSRQTLAPQLRGSGDDLGMLNISKKSLDKIEKTRYSNQPQTTGTISYGNTEVADLPKLTNKKSIVNNNELKEQIDAYEEAYSKIPQSSQNPVHMDIRNKLEDLKATKWLRTEYAQELRAAGLSPSEIEKITIVSSGPRSKSMVDADGNVIGTLNFSESVTQGQRFNEIASTGVSTKYHGYNLKASGFKDWNEAQDALAKRYLDEELNKISNASDKKNPIVIKSLTKKSNERAAAEIVQLQRNNNNRFGEALYRGVHHGIKDTRGGIGTREHFAQTTLTDPITGMPVSRYRAKDYWGSQMRQRNEQGVAKAGRMYGPATETDYLFGEKGPIFILRKNGGDVPKLLRFTQ
jgi:hypothetical protein